MRMRPGFCHVFHCFARHALAQDVQKVLQRDFQARGQATMDRVVQDGLQRLCTDTNDRPPGDVARQLEADQMKTIAFPAGNLIGDWKSGERIAQNGRGLHWTDPAGATGGGSCYNCHQLSPQESSHGTLGPSLLNSAGCAAAAPRCSATSTARSTTPRRTTCARPMPRLGHSGTLTPEQIKDLVGLLLDPASPVNK